MANWQHIIINFLANVVILANMEVKAESSQNRRLTFIMHGSKLANLAILVYHKQCSRKQRVVQADKLYD